MENQIVLDTSLFLYSIVFGFAAGLFFEVFRFVRLALPHGHLLTFFEDLLFFLPVTGIFLLFTFAFSDGVIRWFSVAGAGMGFFLYLATLGKLLSFFADQILRLIRSVLRFVFRKTVTPFLFILKKVTFALFTKGKKAAIIITRKRQSKRIRKQKKSLLQKAKRGFFQQ